MFKNRHSIEALSASSRKEHQSFLTALEVHRMAQSQWTTEKTTMAMKPETEMSSELDNMLFQQVCTFVKFYGSVSVFFRNRGR